MPLPRKLAAFNKHVTNRIARPFAGRAPGFGIVHHIGRKTGRQYQTPVNVFRHDERYLIALVYGGGSWVQNVLASGGCSLETGGHTLQLQDPRRYTDADRSGVPAPVKWILGVLAVDEFLSLRAVPTQVSDGDF